MRKKVVITGVNGFIGSYMAQKCLKNVYDVIGVDIGLNSQVNDINYYQLNLYEGSIDDILRINKPYALIHCAGMADISYSVQHPDSDFASNVIISRKILYSIKEFSRETIVIFLSSAGVYGNPIQNPINEEHEKNPISPYALHKMLVEDICEYFIRQYGIDIRILRVFSAYGVGLKKQIFWDMGQKIKLYNKLELYGTGNETRDFIYIDDLVCAIQIVMESKKQERAVYNIANGIEISIRKVAEIFCEKCGLTKSLITFNQQERIGNPINWCADISKLQKLGYAPKTDIYTGIEKYAEWLKKIEVI